MCVCDVWVVQKGGKGKGGWGGVGSRKAVVSDPNPMAMAVLGVWSRSCLRVWAVMMQVVL